MKHVAPIVVVVLLAGQSLYGQEGKKADPPGSDGSTTRSSQRPPRQAGAADLNAWSRQAMGKAGYFTNPNTDGWIPFQPRREDVAAGGILDVSRFVEKPGGTHGFLKHDGKGNFVFDDGTPARFLDGEPA